MNTHTNAQRPTIGTAAEAGGAGEARTRWGETESASWEFGRTFTTPAGSSPRPGVYAANLTLAPLAIRSAAQHQVSNEREGIVDFRSEAVAGNLTIPETLDISLAPGEVKLLSVHTSDMFRHPINQETTRMAIEWLDGPTDDQQ